MIPFVVIFKLFVGLRLVALASGPTLEGHDSVSYLEDVETIASLDPGRILALDPDASLFYPLVGGLMVVAGLPVETSARLTSLLFQAVLFLALIAIGRRSFGIAALLGGLLLLALNPASAALGIAVRTEPTYVGLVYAGLAIVWARHRALGIGSAVAAGLVFGLAFLTRVEGIIYLTVIPALVTVALVIEREGRFPWRRLSAWSAVFALAFVLVAAPQVWRVSAQMGTFALNGRQAWAVLLNEPGPETYGERIYGLDFSPDTVNITYLKANLDEFTTAPGTDLEGLAGEFAERAAGNLLTLYTGRLTAFLGLSVVVFFAFGLYALVRAGRRLEALLVVLFLAASLVPPLLHNVVIRHIFVIAPLVFLVAAYGLAYMARSLAAQMSPARWPEVLLASALLVLTLVPWGPALGRVATAASSAQNDYTRAELQPFLRVIEQIKAAEGIETPALLARKRYLAYYAKARSVFMPHTDYDAFVNYCRANRVDFVYLQHSLHDDWPFMDRFRDTGGPPDFELLVREQDERTGAPLELYRFRDRRAPREGS